MKHVYGRLLVFVLGFAAWGAELGMDAVSIPRGSGAISAIRLFTGGARVAALQFDVEGNSALTFAGFTGQVAAGAGKSLYSANVGSGGTRFLVAGLNGNTLSDGAVADVFVAVDSSLPPGNYSLRLRNALASDPDGLAVSLPDADGSVTVSDSASDLPSTGAFAHIASGGNWKTSLTLLNTTGMASMAQLAFWDDDGNPLALSLAFPQDPSRPTPTSGSSVAVTIPSNGVVVVEAGGPALPSVQVGWVRLQAPAGVAGWATFRQELDTGGLIEATVPMETQAKSSMMLTFDHSNGMSTGVAMANSSETIPADILMILRGVDGRQLFTDTLTLPARGHRSFPMLEKYPSLAGLAGSVEFQNRAGSPISVIGLRFSQRGSFTSTPPAPR